MIHFVSCNAGWKQWILFECPVREVARELPSSPRLHLVRNFFPDSQLNRLHQCEYPPPEASHLLLTCHHPRAEIWTFYRAAIYFQMPNICEVSLPPNLSSEVVSSLIYPEKSLRMDGSGWWLLIFVTHSDHSFYCKITVWWLATNAANFKKPAVSRRC